MIIKTFNSAQVYKANEFIAEVHAELKTIEKSFFTIGYKLNEAEESRHYEALGYSDIYELAEKEFNIGKTTTKNLKTISRQFKDASEPTKIDTKYQGYNQSQLVELSAMNPSDYDMVDADFTRDDIRDLKKVLEYCHTKESQEIFGRNFDLTPAQVRQSPKLYIEKLRQWKKDNPGGKKKAPTVEQPLEGQLCLTDDGDVTDYYQDGGQEILSSQRADREAFAKSQLAQMFAEADATEPAKTFAGEYEPKEYNKTPTIEVADGKIYPRTIEVVKTLSPKVHKFKNVKERESFIKNEENFKDLIFADKETGLTVRSLTFANGAILYRMTWQEFIPWNNRFIQRSRLCLVADSEEKDANGMTFSTKCFNLAGTAPTYVINYMTKYSGEI